MQYLVPNFVEKTPFIDSLNFLLRKMYYQKLISNNKNIYVLTIWDDANATNTNCDNFLSNFSWIYLEINHS